MNIRNSAKAIIFNGEKILLTKNEGNDGLYYLFPGGGQEHGETISNALIRECIEEVGQEVQIGELLHIREYIGKNHEYAAYDLKVHQIEYYFICSLVNKMSSNKIPTNPDSYQVGLEWVDIKDLKQYRIYPKELSKYIVKYIRKENAPVYLGDIN
ncbi:NUDIX domain-containing protein [Cytobacillus sp. Hm23]